MSDKRTMLVVSKIVHDKFKKLAEKEKRKLYDMVEIVLSYYLQKGTK